jgi:acetyl esterase/lipase
MIYKQFEIKENGSLPGSNLTVFIQESSEKFKIKERPLIIICPGGGYSYTSDREAEPIAFSFLAKGYHAAILRYSCEGAHYPTALLELARSVLIIREHAGEWMVKDNAIVVQGSSAGGHLAASYSCMWKDELFKKELDLTDNEILRPNGLMLSYPVITSGEHAHRGSFENLLGPRYDELVDKMSLEGAVNENVPRTFMWHTFTDQAVPVENSLLFATALRKQGINTELHIFPEGCHGLALANRLTEGPDGKEIAPCCEVWIDMAATWMEHYAV